MAAKFKYRASVDDNGKISKIHGVRGFNADLKLFAGKEIWVEFYKYTKSRTNKQSSYYWAVVVPYVTDYLVEAGWDRYKLNTEVVHEFLKEKFLKHDVVNEIDGQILTVTRSTSDLSTVEMAEYIDNINRWCLEFFNVGIPAPNSQSEFNF